MNILTDILSLIKRGVFTKNASPEDVIILGVNEQPDMTGVASPIPYKSVKLIKVKDLKIAPAFCDNENSPTIPAAGTGQVFKQQTIDPITNVCTNYFRSLKSLSNLGTGTGLYASKTGETLNFKSLKGTGVSISQTATEVSLNHATKVILTAPNGALWEVTISNSGGIITTAI